MPEHKRLELMEQVRSGKITVQQMDAQLAYLGASLPCCRPPYRQDHGPPAR